MNFKNAGKWIGISIAPFLFIIAIGFLPELGLDTDFLTNILKVLLGSPVLMAAVILLAVKMFRDEIANLIGRIRKIGSGKFWAELTAEMEDFDELDTSSSRFRYAYTLGAALFGTSIIIYAGILLSRVASKSGREFLSNSKEGLQIAAKIATQFELISAASEIDAIKDEISSSINELSEDELFQYRERVNKVHQEILEELDGWE